MKKNIICGLDIGTFKICATCGRVTPSGKIDILASQTISTQGIKGGRIIDSKKVSFCLRDACRKLRKMCGLKIRRVYANIDSPDLRAKVCTGKLSFAEKTMIRKAHIKELIDSCVTANVSWDRKVIHTGFRNFVLDNQLSSAYPEGYKAYELKLNIVVISTLIPTINSFIKCVQDAGLILEDVVPSGCAQALSLVKDFKQDKGRSNVLIDVGSALTKITLSEDKKVKAIAILPEGAHSITEDIASKLRVSVDCAEQLKIEYGRVFDENRLLNQKLIVQSQRASKIVQLGHLYEIINLKVDQILQQIKKALLELNNADTKVTQIIVTGGGSILEGFLERAEQILAKPVKMGFLSAVKDNYIQARSAFYATSIGLIYCGCCDRDNTSFYKGRRFGLFVRLAKRAEQLYHEYF